MMMRIWARWRAMDLSKAEFRCGHGEKITSYDCVWCAEEQRRRRRERDLTKSPGKSEAIPTSTLSSQCNSRHPIKGNRQTDRQKKNPSQVWRASLATDATSIYIHTSSTEAKAAAAGDDDDEDEHRILLLQRNRAELETLEMQTDGIIQADRDSDMHAMHWWKEEEAPFSSRNNRGKRVPHLPETIEPRILQSGEKSR